MKVEPGSSRGPRLTTGEVVPPTATSAPRTTSSIVSLATTGMPSAWATISARRPRASRGAGTQRISSKAQALVRQRNAFVPMVPMPTRPRIFGLRGPTHLHAMVAAAALRMA